MAAANKTKPEATDVGAYLAAVEPAAKRAEAETIAAMMGRASGEPAVMWGPSIIGFGKYHYKYESGREGDAPRIGFSPRKPAHVLYICDGFPGHADLMARLGKYSIGKSCLYIKRLADVDVGVLDQLIRESVAVMRERYPE